MLELEPYPDNGGKRHDTPIPATQHDQQVSEAPKSEHIQGAVPKKKHILWFSHEAAENLSLQEIITRLCGAYLMPWLSVIDWDYHVHTIVIVVILGYYLMASAMTGYDPVKDFFQRFVERQNP